MKINTFVKNFNGRMIDNWGEEMSPDAKKFNSNFKAVVKEIALKNNAELVKFLSGHYYSSGFIKKGDKYVYFLRNIERCIPINLRSDSYMQGILIRTAKDDKDYYGNDNHYCSIDNFEVYMNMLLK